MIRITPVFVSLLLVACSPGDDAHPVVGETASDRIELTLETDEPVIHIHVREGDTLKAGQRLLEQDPRRAMARLEEAEAAVREAQARLDELERGPRRERIAQARASYAGAESELAFRSTELDRIRSIRERGLTSPETLDQAQAAFDDATSRLALRRAELEELLTGTTVEELTQAGQAVQRLAARRDAAAIDLERLTLAAPVDGILDSRLIEVGERPAPGRPVFVMLSGEQVYARVYVPEALRAGVAPGDAATIRVDGLDRVLDGRIRHVSSDPVFTPYFALTEHDRGHLSYEAKVDIVSDIDRLPDGIPLEVQFGDEP